MLNKKTIQTLLTAGAFTLLLPMAANAQSVNPSPISEIEANYGAGEILSQEEANSVKENAIPITNINTFSNEMTTNEINAKLTEIADKYEIGEIFSEEDANFVKLHAIPVNQNFSTQSVQSSSTPQVSDASWYFKGNFNKVELTGHGTHDIGFVNNFLTGNFVIRDTNQEYHSSIGSVVQVRAFGLFGEGGTNIGLVFSKDYTNSAKNANYNKNVFEDHYVASVAYATYTVRGLVDGYSFLTETP
ncbi:hypothetical protein [Paenibacillus tundrae]|uniref:hypothetical protein n=1 Tax=Paenibacillus tundrae TaxID=528187 RepID=UPI0030D1C4B7